VIDERGLFLIQQQIRRDGRSLLQYVGEAFPYAPVSAEATQRRVAELAREEQEAIGRLIRFLQRHHATPPVLGAFPSSFTTINFISLEHLLPALVKDQQRAVAELQHELGTLPDGEVRHLLWEYLEMKRKHLQVLEGVHT
jgi:hypothetical protein